MIKTYYQALLSCAIIAYCSCGSSKPALTKPINGYITFEKVQFSTGDEEVSISLTYTCHGVSGVSSYLVLNRINEELKDITSIHEMPTPVSSFSDSTGNSIIKTKYYYKVEAFFKSLNNRLKAVFANPHNFPMPVFNMWFFKDSAYNMAVLKCSQSLFEFY